MSKIKNLLTGNHETGAREIEARIKIIQSNLTSQIAQAECAILTVESELEALDMALTEKSCDIAANSLAYIAKVQEKENYENSEKILSARMSELFGK